MKQKNFFTLLVAIVVVGGLIGGAFAGGIAIGKSQGEERVSQELQGRFEQFSLRFGQEGMPQPGTQSSGGFFGRGGTMGTVEKIEGNVLTLNTMQGTTVQVLISDSTTVQKMAEGSLDDISSGDNVTVSGERNEDGSIDATNIFITPFITPSLVIEQEE